MQSRPVPGPAQLDAALTALALVDAALDGELNARGAVLLEPEQDVAAVLAYLVWVITRLLRAVAPEHPRRPIDALRAALLGALATDDGAEGEL